MKKLFVGCAVVAMMISLLGTDIRRETTVVHVNVKPEKPCYGYTIIEFGRGIDCNGDTVKLVKVNGGQQRIL